MIDIKQAKKIPFEQLDSESQEYFYNMFKKYVVRKQIADTNKELISLFAKKMHTNKPQEYSKGFNLFNNYFANANLIGQLNYDEVNTDYLKKLTEDNFNYHLQKNGGSFERKIALICYSKRPSERIANRLDFSAMQAYANMQTTLLDLAKTQPTSSLESLISLSAKKIRKDFEQQNGYALNLSPIAGERTDYKSVGKKMAPIWEKLMLFYMEKLNELNSDNAESFILDNFIFTNSTKLPFKLKTNEARLTAERKVNERRNFAKMQSIKMPHYYDTSDYDEIFSNSFKEEIFRDELDDIFKSVFNQYLSDPIFSAKTDAPKIKQ